MDLKLIHDFLGNLLLNWKLRLMYEEWNTHTELRVNNKFSVRAIHHRNQYTTLKYTTNLRIPHYAKYPWPSKQSASAAADIYSAICFSIIILALVTREKLMS
jgi:hypothetical protein